RPGRGPHLRQPTAGIESLRPPQVERDKTAIDDQRRDRQRGQKTDVLVRPDVLRIRGAPALFRAKFIPQTTPALRRYSRTASAACSGVRRSVSRRSSGLSGTSYGESIPVKFLISPRRAFRYRPFGSRASASSSRS